MVLMSPWLAALDLGVRLSRKTLKIIRQNFTRALLYNVTPSRSRPLRLSEKIIRLKIG
jgi:hypothetical protein